MNTLDYNITSSIILLHNILRGSLTAMIITGYSSIEVLRFGSYIDTFDYNIMSSIILLHNIIRGTFTAIFSTYRLGNSSIKVLLSRH